jgi:lipoprotein-anchoring transpeptidase ErfK/SrfK
MTTRRRTAALAALGVTTMLALGACGKATPRVEVNGQALPPATETPTTVAPPPTAPPKPAGTSTNVQATRATLDVHADPSTTSPVVTSLQQKTKLGSRTTLLVLDARNGWFRVALPTRPNGSSGWVAAGDVQVRSDDLAVQVDLGHRTLTVLEDAKPVVQTPVAVGATATPTPTGTFYVTDLLDTGNANGDYGPYAFGLSGHSDSLTEFAGGDGQIGVHGTNDPSSIGQAVSHGCVRLPNDLITKLSKLVPLGTPVTIA